MDKTLKIIDRKILVYKLLGYFGIACFVIPIFTAITMFVCFSVLGLDIDIKLDWFPIVAIVMITLFACSSYILRYSVINIEKLQIVKIRTGLIK